MLRHSPADRWGVYFDDDTPRIEVTPGVTVPAAFRYVVSPPDVPLIATVHIHLRDGIAVCDRVELERHDGKSITAQDVRTVSFGQLIADAPWMAAGVHTSGPVRVGDPALVAADDYERVRRAIAANPNIPVDLADVAKVYRGALKAGKPPTAAVADAFGLTPRTASRRVADARKAGHLGEALDRRAGEKIRGGA